MLRETDDYLSYPRFAFRREFAHNIITHQRRSLIPTTDIPRQLIDFVLMNIKFDTLRKFSLPLPRSRFLNSGLEGFESSEIVMRSNCDLHTFVSIAAQIDQRHTETSPTYMHLNPIPRSFVNPSRATGSLSVDFSNCFQLFLAMEIWDSGDHRQAAVKTSTRKGRGMLRLLGSKCVIKLDPTTSGQPSTEVDCIFPF